MLLSWLLDRAARDLPKAVMAETGKQQAQAFPTTWWTLIDQALADGTTIRNTALEQLVLRYAPPLRAHLVLRKRVRDELADELLQGFLTEKFATQYLLRHVDRSKGKLRSLLVRSLENYFADWCGKQAIQPVLAVPEALDVVSDDRAPQTDLFDLAWARQLLEEVLAAMQAECEANSQTKIWGVFDARLLRPTREGVEPLAYEMICERFGFTSPVQASNALVTAKQKFKRIFERVAANYQHDGEQADDILRELIGILSRAGPLEWQQVPNASFSAVSRVGQSNDELEDSEPGLIARLLETTPDRRNCGCQMTCALMRHQLAQRLSDLDADLVDDLIDTADDEGAETALVTLDDLFHHPAPPLSLLNAVKRFGRNQVHEPDRALPEEIASALYFGSIAAVLFNVISE